MIDPDVPTAMARFAVTSTGRIGMVVFVHPGPERFARRVCLQFTNSGSTRLYSPATIRWATHREVTAAGLDGVGHTPIYAFEKDDPRGNQSRTKPIRLLRRRAR